MKFSYTALTKDNRKATGVLEMANEEAAKAELHKMEVAIISLKEISEEEYKTFEKEEAAQQKEKGIQSFTFLAKDPTGKEAEGTIDALEDYSAYKRLRTEYQFTISKLYLSSASETEIAAANAKLPEFEARFSQEKPTSAEEPSQATEASEIQEAESRINQEIISEIDKVIINSKKTIEVHQNLFSNDLLQEINEKLGELERVRSSNNIKHITEVSNDLYALISNPDKIEGGVKNEAYESLVHEMGESALVKREFDLYKKAVEATGVKKLLKKVSGKINKITETTDQEEKKPGFIAKLKKRIHQRMENSAKAKAKKAAAQSQKPIKPPSKLSKFLGKFSAYFKAEGPVLKKTRQRELVKAMKELFGKKEKADEGGVAKKEEVAAQAKEKHVKKGRDFTNLFIEIDSVAAWLLTLYILYFFLVSFSLEKGVGLSPEFIFKTLTSPLLLNITIFLLIIHFALRLRNLHLRHHFFASLFLIVMSIGAYVLLILNF